MKGKTALELQAKHGFTRPETIACLQSYVVEKGIEAAANTGDAPRVDSVWRVQLKNGGNVRAIAADNGITSPYLLNQMNRLATTSEHTKARLLSGTQKVRDIADSIGVNGFSFLADMETFVVAENAEIALRSGTTPEAFIAQYGLTTSRAKSQLHSLVDGM
jgi:hypothetical protein